MNAPAHWHHLLSCKLPAPDIAHIGESAAREREAREGTVQHTLIDSLYVRSWT
jgi:hypothetical protein